MQFPFPASLKPTQLELNPIHPTHGSYFYCGICSTKFDIRKSHQIWHILAPKLTCNLQLTCCRKLQGKIDACNAWAIDDKLDEAMEALRCPARDAKIANLSGGELRRIAICRLLLCLGPIVINDDQRIDNLT